METVKNSKRKTPGIHLEVLKIVVEKHAIINKAIEEGKAIDPELSKNFVDFPLSDNPYKD